MQILGSKKIPILKCGIRNGKRKKVEIPKMFLGAHLRWLQPFYVKDLIDIMGDGNTCCENKFKCNRSLTGMTN